MSAFLYTMCSLNIMEVLNKDVLLAPASVFMTCILLTERKQSSGNYDGDM